MKKIILTTFVLIASFLIVLVSYNPGQANDNVVIDFEGLNAGDFVQKVSYGQGIHGRQIDGSVTIFGHNKFFPGENAAMIFDAACPGGCTGFDFDLFAPDQGKVLIVSQNLDPDDPNDAEFAVTQELYFQDLGIGKVTVESLIIGDVEDYEEGGMLEFYSDGSEGTLLATIPIPITGNNEYEPPIQVGVSGVDYMRISLKGSAAIDDIILTPEPDEDVLYLSDTALKTDGISNLFRVEIDEVNSSANLILLPNGRIDYNHVDTLASTPDGSRLYFVHEETRDDGKPAILGYYDHETASVQEIGEIYVDGDRNNPVEIIDQAAFSPDGILYITGSRQNMLYIVNPENAEAVELGTVVTEKESEEVILNIAGADIAFTENGTLYLWINRGKEDAPAGLYLLTLPNQDDSVKASHLGLGDEDHIFLGLALRDGGIGDLVGMTRDDQLHIMDRADASDVIPPLPIFKDGEPFDATSGDMSIGPFTEGNVSSP